MAGESNHYDVVVYGPDLAGLVAAALLGKRGYRVLLCGHDAVPASFTAGGYTLAREPATLPPVDGIATTRVLRELNHLPVVRRRAAPLWPGLVCRVSGHRLVVDRTAGNPDGGVATAFPDDVDAVATAATRLRATSALLDSVLGADLALPPDGFWQRREVARIERQLPPAGTDLCEGLPGDHPLRIALTAIAALGTSFGPQDLGVMPPARAFDLATRGHHRLDGGLPVLRSLFLDKIATSSGDIREAATAVELVERRGRVSALRLKPRDELVGLDTLVWTGSAASLLALLGDRPSRRLREIAGAVRPACYRYVLAGLIAAAGVPPDFGSRCISVTDPARPPLEDNALLITLGAPASIAAGAESAVPIWIECLVPAPAVAAGPGYLTLVRSRAREHLARLFPDFEQHLLVLASLHDGLAPEVRTPGPAAASRGADPLPASPMAPVLSSDLPRFLDVGAAPPDTGIKNVLLGGGEALPGLGREGELITGHSIAHRVVSAFPKRTGRKRDIYILDA